MRWPISPSMSTFPSSSMRTSSCLTVSFTCGQEVAHLLKEQAIEDITLVGALVRDPVRMRSQGPTLVTTRSAFCLFQSPEVDATSGIIRSSFSSIFLAIAQAQKPLEGIYACTVAQHTMAAIPRCPAYHSSELMRTSVCLTLTPIS